MSKAKVEGPQHPWWGVRPFERHGVVLAVAGTVYIMIGWTFAFLEPTVSRVVALQYATEIISFKWWGVIFMASGLLALLSARWPPISETWGYTLLTGLSAGWAAFYAAGVFIVSSPIGNVAGALTWGLMAFMWWAISGLVNPAAYLKLMTRLNILEQENLALQERLGRYEGRKE